MLTISALREKYGAGIQLRPDLLTEWGDDRLTLHGDKMWELRGLKPADMAFLRSLSDGLVLAPSLPESGARIWKLLTFFADKGLLKSLSPTGYEHSPFERQVEWLSYFSPEPAGVQEDLRRKRVAIIGCGGTGALIALHLARAGVGRFLLIDGAEVDLPDLNRQLSYFPKDLGVRKTEALGRHLAELDPAIERIAHAEFIDGPESLRALLERHPCELVINCADKPVGLVQAWAVSGTPAGIPVLFGGVGLESASIGPLLTEPEARRAFQRDMESGAARLDESARPLKASLCFTNTIASTWIAFEAFRYLSGVGAPLTRGRSLRLDFASGALTTEKNWNEAAPEEARCER